MKIIISNPHTYCLSNVYYRHCDTLAEEFADSIKCHLLNTDLEVIHLKSDVFRGDMDLNRKDARNSNYRKLLNSELELLHCNLSCNDILLDIHSAPEDTLINNGINDFEIYFLDIDKIDTDDFFISKLNEYLRKKKVESYIISGSQVNDIVVTAMLNYGIKNIALVEINESISNNRLNKIAFLFSNFILNINKLDEIFT